MHRKAREVKKALKLKGFREEERDHWYYFFYHDGKKTDIYTKISHNESDISRPLCSAMARQMRLSSGQFEEFVNCDLTGEKYLKHLTDAKHLQAGDKKSGRAEGHSKHPR